MSVTLYTGTACPFCIIVKKYLERNKIEFTEIDISKNQEKKEEIKKKSGTQFDPKVVEAFLRIPEKMIFKKYLELNK